MIAKEDLRTVREKAASINAMVIGDAMIDRYITGHVDRISPEAPVPVLIHHSTTQKAGGAANVALNLSAWGCKTSLIGMIGHDINGTDLRSLLDKHHIAHHLFVESQRPTTVKTRVVASTHHLMRIDEESSQYLDADKEDEAFKFISKVLSEEKPDLIILADYNKGFLTQRIISLIINYGRTHNAFVAVDPKEKNFESYTGANLFKPNLREANHAAHKQLMESDLLPFSDERRSGMEIDVFAITLGGNGIFLLDDTGHEFVQPVKMIDVVDVCGAGDAVICALALARMSGLDLKKSGGLANLTGAYVCSHSGVVTIDPKELLDWI